MYKVLSFVIPCYNEEQMIPVFYQETIKVMSTLQNLTFEFFLWMMVQQMKV
jgi:glycosyltransferase involved in cell wall biosynthesis